MFKTCIYISNVKKRRGGGTYTDGHVQIKQKIIIIKINDNT